MGSRSVDSTNLPTSGNASAANVGAWSGLILAIALVGGAFLLWQHGFSRAAAMLLGGGCFAVGLGTGLWVGSSRWRPAASGPARGAGRRELDDLRRAAAAAQDDLDTLQHSVSHDMRSPIGAILNFTTVLEEDHGSALDPAARAILMRIRRSAESALVLLDGMLRLSRVARPELRPERVDVEPLVRDAFRAVAPARGTVELSIGSLPPVVADAALLRLVFVELLGNAVKFGAPREKAHVAVAGRVGSSGLRIYTVSDDGVGFDPRFARKLFGAFERLHARDEFPGAGVGLAIVRRIAERHGGRAWAEGEPDRGARVHVALPPAPEEGS